MTVATSIPFIAPADSARAVASVYTASLLVLVPLVLAGVAAVALRRAGAESRVLVWRSALVALLVVFVGRQLPMHWTAWIVPSTLATPLIALGRVQVTATPELASDGTFISAIFAAYLLGAAFVIVPTGFAALKMRRLAARARPLATPEWTSALADAKQSVGVARTVRLLASAEVTVPMTWGWIHPVVAIPEPADRWSADERAIILRHELVHVRAGDWVFGIVARFVCALYWFHPGAWWIARTMRDDCEIASDDRVVASGVRRSDYAELLIGAADRFLVADSALALSGRRGLRARLALVLDADRRVEPLARRWVAAAAACTLAAAGPISAVQLAPTRAVLTTLMRDARWESRAYAVIGLARRPDSVAVAREAAEQDPNPRVRAWARLALREGDATQLRTILHQ
jgi:beta-lactamase regulating signal transducer with metallopeptidase domain